MGVSYNENHIQCSKNDQPTGKITEINVNAIYRNDAIYKECSYQIYSEVTTIKNNKAMKRPISSTNSVTTANKKYKTSNSQWSKVYKSPPTTKRQVEKTDLFTNMIDFPVATNAGPAAIVVSPATIDVSPATIDASSAFATEHIEDINSSLNDIKVQNQSVGTSVTSLVKYIKAGTRRVSLWARFVQPTLLCPCCTGGGADQACVEQPYTRSPFGDSYESIDLKKLSNGALPYLDMDPSLISIIQLHRKLKTKKTSKLYGKIVKNLLHNTYKNAVCLIDPLKNA